MESKKAGKLKRNLKINKTFDVRKVRGLSNKNDWNLIVYETTETGLLSNYLTHYEFMITFGKKNECGLLIEASGNLSRYLLY